MVLALPCLASLKNFSSGSSTSNGPSYGLLRGRGEGGKEECLSFLIKTNLAVFSLGQMLDFGLPYLVVGMVANYSSLISLTVALWSGSWLGEGMKSPGT